MSKALIGSTGFVGVSLLSLTDFTSLYNSTNIEEIKGKSFDMVVCAGAPGVKWIANKNPEEDLKSIERLMDSLRNVRCKRFVLISTVDVFPRPVGVDEDTEINLHGFSGHYGYHRRVLEKFVEMNFENHLIIRLPALVGSGLKKNAVFDLHNNNNIFSLNYSDSFQFYPMKNLWHDIGVSLANDLSLVHFTSAPVKLGDIALDVFGFELPSHARSEILYDYTTKHSSLWGSFNGYIYSANQVKLMIAEYASTEPKDGN